MAAPGCISRRDLARLAALPLLAAIAPGSPAHADQIALHGAFPRMKERLYPFATAPFPYTGRIPDSGKEFLDTTVDGRRGHTSPRGGVYFQDQTYSDNRVLVALPAGFDLGLPAAIVVFFHGNQSTLERDVVGRQRVLAQLQASRLNAALLAPQLAVDALDSSAGKFWQPGAFGRFLDEASGKLAELWGDPETRRQFEKMPVFLVAFSGGYDPAAFAASVGEVSDRIAGITLLDALYGEIGRFADWIAAHNDTAFFFSAYTDDLASENATLRGMLNERGVGYTFSLPKELRPGEIVFLNSPGLEHRDYVTRAWVGNPLTDLLNRIPGFPRGRSGSGYLTSLY